MAPAGDDQGGHPVPVGPGDGGAQLPGGLRPLNPHRDHRRLSQGPASPQYAQHVPHRRPRRRGDEGDPFGEPGNGLLVGLVEQPLPVQLLLELLKGDVQLPHPVGGELAAVELILAVPGEHGHPAEGHHLHAVLRPEPEAGGLPAEHDAPDGPLRVLEGEVVVAGGVALVVGDLPPHKKAGQSSVAIQQALDILVDLGDAVDGRGVHASPSCSRARWARIAAPMALSVE